MLSFLLGPVLPRVSYNGCAGRTFASSLATEIAIVNHGRLLRHAAPEAILAEVVGRVWEWTVSSANLQAARQRYLISNTIRRTDGLQLRVIADEAPDASARAATPTLEDAYLAVIHEESLRQAA